MTARVTQMHKCWALAQRALSTSANSTLHGSQLASPVSLETCRAAVSIAAARIRNSLATNTSLGSTFNRHFSQAAVAEHSQPEIQLTAAAIERIQELNQKNQNLVLQLRVDAGGCSGFSYNFDLVTEASSDDIVVQQQGVQLVTDTVSYELLKGATVDYTTDLIRASFEVTQNPNASGKCGCGASFEPKM